MVVSFFLVIGNSNCQHLPITIIVQHFEEVKAFLSAWGELLTAQNREKQQAEL
jgi:hypothetical protein